MCSIGRHTQRHLFEDKNTRTAKILASMGLFETATIQNDKVKVHYLQNWTTVTYNGFFLFYGHQIK